MDRHPGLSRSPGRRLALVPWKNGPGSSTTRGGGAECVVPIYQFCDFESYFCPRLQPMLEELLGGLFHIARADQGISTAKMNFLRRVSDIFGFDAARFARVRDRFLPPPSTDPYNVLGISANLSDDEVKKAYRRLIREHHPDTLVARGLPREFLAQANERMAAINAAYDDICKRRGLS